MPINAYIGLPRSGKSYECVTSVIVPAIKNGRRVVTNVDGIDGDAIRAYCQEKWSIEPDKLGHVVHCHNDEVGKASFLPHGKDVDTFCKPGDLVCIDEAWRFWGSDCKLLPEHKVFFREHGHYVDPESNVTCDLVLMVQDITDLHRTLKVVVEVTFRTTKIKSLGLDKTYRIEMWEGYKLTQRSRVSVENKQYQKDLFPLYSSYQGGTGKEMRVDDRQNVLKSPKLWVLAGLVIALFVGSLYSAISFFGGSKYKREDAKAQGSSGAARQGPPISSGAANTSRAPDVSDLWRVVGSYQVGMTAFVVLANDVGSIRVEHPSAFQNSGIATIGHVDGQRVMYWSGVPHHQKASQ